MEDTSQKTATGEQVTMKMHVSKPAKRGSYHKVKNLMIHGTQKKKKKKKKMTTHHSW
jgi:hypothetical protein